ncbi:hypothetical protein LLH00_10365 [bacterium]|nr:hypothetical protein [bacterium]
MHDRYPLLKLCVVALLLGLAATLRAEMKSKYNSQGNNVGITFNQSIVGSAISSEYDGSGGDHQFPRGSGNFYRIGRYSWGLAVATDYDGDGVAGDTVTNQSRGHEWVASRQSLEYRDKILEMATAGEDMEDAASRISVNRIWTSLDPEDLADWPVEFREGRTASGAPILHGAETVVSLRGNAFKTWGNNRLGASIEYAFYFLNYAESNNMVYMHVFFQNMSEYCQYNDDDVFLAKIAGTASTGQTWKSMQMTFAISYVGTNGNSWGDWAWAHRYYPKQTFAIADGDGVKSSYSGYPVILASHLLRLPTLRGEQLRISNTNQNYWDTELGFSPLDPMITDGKDGDVYRFGLGRLDPNYPTETYVSYYNNVNPWYGGPCYGWPGVPQEGDSRYDKWIWGRGNCGFVQAWYSDFHDVAPRDSFSLDNVLMFVPAVSDPFVWPRLEYANIDDPTVQTQLSRVDDYVNVAGMVYEGGYVLPETPSPPPLTIIPGDKQVTITWNDVNVNTPDAYYGFLQQHPELDPNHVYRQYDFEGYRLYRSFVGPNDSHSEMLMDCSLSADNVQFYYIDKQTADTPFYRMNNGMKIWYALVPYDKNYDTGTGAEFSLPALTSGKVWNRPGNGLYNVEARSDAANFRLADLDGEVGFVAADGSTPDASGSVVLHGPGDGSLSDPPLQLVPLPLKAVNFIPVNNERLTTAKTLYLVTADRIAYDDGCAGQRQNVENVLTLVDGSYTSAGKPLDGGAAAQPSITMQGAVDASGVNYAIEFTFNGMDRSGSYGSVYLHADVGGYSGASVEVLDARWCGPTVSPGTAPSNLLTTKAGRYQVTWKDAGGGNLTVEVKDLTRNVDLTHVDYPDEWGWGFQTKEGYGGDMGAGGSRGVYYDEAFVNHLPKAQRTAKMAATMPAGNSDKFGLFVNGILWVFHKDMGDGITMPAAGATFSIDNAYGYWNGDNTEFTQIPDMAHIGDKWEIKIKPSTLNAEDADLGKIKVVPNPYLASSFLDLSPDSRRIDFVNLPDRCTIRIYSMGGHLVNVLNHIGANRHGWGNYTDYDRLDSKGNPAVLSGYDNHGGNEPWNLRNRFGQTVASGLYIFHVTDSRGKTFAGKFYIVN